MILCFYWNALFYGLINPRLVVSWWNLVAPGMANLDHYYDFIHRKCSFKDISTHQTYTFKLLIQPSSEIFFWCWLFNRIKIKNCLLLKFSIKMFYILVWAWSRLWSRFTLPCTMDLSKAQWNEELQTED